jgi:sulfopyruvate decarboxylase subunit alpha
MQDKSLPSNDAPVFRAPTGGEVLNALLACNVQNVVTVSDWVQLPLQRALDAQSEEKIVTRKCCTEDEAFMLAAGLHIGGQRSAIVIQNQGLYAGLNALRGIGLDSNLPLVMMIGQFGRESGNFNTSTRNSSRRMVRILEPLLEMLEIPYWKVSTSSDLTAISAAFDSAEAKDWPTAVIFDLNMSWE